MVGHEERFVLSAFLVPAGLSSLTRWFASGWQFSNPAWFGFQATLRAVQHTGKLEFDRLPLVSGGLEETNNYSEEKLTIILGGYVLYRENRHLTSVSKWRL